MDRRYVNVFTGSYADEAEEAVQWLIFDTESGSLERVGGVSGIANPSFLTIDVPRSRLYSVSETEHGEIVSFAIDWERRTLTEINRKPTQGAAPCHVTVDEAGKWLTLVNYMTGTVCLYPIEESGAVGDMADLVRHTGSSVNAERQEAPHTHSIYPIPEHDGHYLVMDLGTDKLYTYRLDAAAGRLLPVAESYAVPGSGPRHAAFHPAEPVVYVIHELNGTIGVYVMGENGEAPSLRQTVSTLPSDFHGVNSCAEVAVSPSGRFVYGSNRGHDSIAIFRTGEDGSLNAIGHVPTLGRSPRNFTLLAEGSFLLAANQDSDSIVVMKVGEDGIPVPTGDIFKTKKPVCLRAVPAGSPPA